MFAKPLMLGLAAMISFMGCRRSGVTAEGYRSEIARVLPVGTSRDRVIHVLDSLHVEHSPYDSASKTIKAIVRNVDRTLVTTRSLQLNFEFDERSQLKLFTVRDAVTGLRGRE
jgi:hypothetical protein